METLPQRAEQIFDLVWASICCKTIGGLLGIEIIFLVTSVSDIDLGFCSLCPFSGGCSKDFPRNHASSTFTLLAVCSLEITLHLNGKP